MQCLVTEVDGTRQLCFCGEGWVPGKWKREAGDRETDGDRFEDAPLAALKIKEQNYKPRNADRL